jgi:hypothetical protein
MRSILKWYLSHLKTDPMVTNVGSALVLMTTGDFMAQEVELHHLVGSKEEGVHHAATRFTTSVSPEQQAKLPEFPS